MFSSGLFLFNDCFVLCRKKVWVRLPFIRSRVVFLAGLIELFRWRLVSTLTGSELHCFGHFRSFTIQGTHSVEERRGEEMGVGLWSSLRLVLDAVTSSANTTDKATTNIALDCPTSRTSPPLPAISTASCFFTSGHSLHSSILTHSACTVKQERQQLSNKTHRDTLRFNYTH
jgi:hypothetical protein